MIRPTPSDGNGASPAVVVLTLILRNEGHDPEFDSVAYLTNLVLPDGWELKASAELRGKGPFPKEAIDTYNRGVARAINNH